MATPVEIAVRTRGTDSARRELQQLRGETGRVGSSIKRGIAVGAAAGAAGLLALGKAAISAASDAQQSLGATRTVFGKYSREIITESNRANKALGLSANEYRELANVTGAMLSGAGIPIRKTTDLTQKLQERAADLAATFGGPTRQAVEAIGSLLRGEQDPIEQYGVSIKQSDINARLAAQGLDELEGAGRKQAEMQARLDLLFQKTSKSAGAFARESDTAAGQGQRLSASWENLQATGGRLLLPLVTKLAESANEKLIPALEDMIPSADEVARALSEAADTLEPAVELVKTLGSVAADAAGFVNDLPGPVKELAAQAAIAAVILPRLTGAMGFVSTRASAMVGGLRSAETRTRMLGTAARNAAGIAGMLALAQGAGKAETATGDLLTVAGAAATGFAVGGPVGAALGAAGGIFLSYKQNAQKAAESTSAFSSENLKLKDSLDQVTGAATRATRELIAQDLQKQGLLQSAATLGIASRDVVSAVLGEASARGRLNQAIRENRNVGGALATDQQIRQSDAAVNLAAYIGGATRAYKRQADQIRDTARASSTWREALEGFPKEVRIAVRQTGTDASVKDLVKLRRQYDLTPKQVRTVIRALNASASVREVMKYARGVKEGTDRAARDAAKGGAAVSRNLREGTSKARPDLNPFDRVLSGNLRRIQQDATLGGLVVSRNLAGGTSKARPDLDPFQARLNATLNSISARARSGGDGIGAGIAEGAAAGVRARAGQVAAEAGAMVLNAITHARRMAKMRSPSKETEKIGRGLGDGLVVGMRRSRAKSGREASQLMRRVLKSARDSAKTLRATVRDVLRGRDLSGAELKRSVRRLDDESRTLLRNARARARVNTKLREARQRLRDLNQESRDYAASVKGEALAYASVTNLDSAFNADAIAAAMGSRLDKLRQFSDLLAQLRAAGLNQATLDQLVQGGVEGGLAYADAIASGGAGAIEEINALQSEIAGVAGGLGNTAADNMYAAGIEAAEGLVRGLESRKKQLDRVANRIARQLVRAIRRELGIKSPSTVFRGLGEQTVAGLRIGIESGRGRHIGEVLARDLQTGFSRPKLTARRVWDETHGRGAPTQRVSIHFTAQQVSQLQRGRDVIADIDVAMGHGVKPRTRP